MNKDMTLDEILIKYFGSGFPFPEAPSCESYEKLISLLYDVADLTETDVNNMVETLDDIAAENAVRDGNGNLVYDQNQAREILTEENSD